MAFTSRGLTNINSKILQSGVIDGSTSTVWYDSSFANRFITDPQSTWLELSSITPAANRTQARAFASSNPTIIEDISETEAAVRLTAATGVSNTYVAYTTPGDVSTAVLNNWVQPQLIPQANGQPSFGYAVSLYHGDPNAGGIQIPVTAGQSGSGENTSVGWVFNYAAGILLTSDGFFTSSFATDNNITTANFDPYILGFRYVGRTSKDNIIPEEGQAGQFLRLDDPAVGTYVWATPPGASSGLFIVDEQQTVNTIRIDVSGTASYATDDWVVGSSQLDDANNSDLDARLFFDKSKGAFRAGRVQGTQWDDTSRGLYSAAFGRDTVASGEASVAMGQATQVTGARSLVIGNGGTSSSFPTVSDSHAIAVILGDTGTGTAHGWVKLLADSDGSGNRRAAVEITTSDQAPSDTTDNRLYVLSDGLYWQDERLITNAEFTDASNPPFTVTNDVIRINNNSDASDSTSDFVVGSSQLNDTGNSNNHRRLLFDKSAGAFRAGTATGTEWDTRASHSAAFGFNNSIPSGSSSAVFGSYGTIRSILGSGGINSILLAAGSVNDRVELSEDSTIAVGLRPVSGTTRWVKITADANQDGTGYPAIELTPLDALETIANTANRLYNDGGDLYWDGTQLNTGSGTTDAGFVNDTGVVRHNVSGTGSYATSDWVFGSPELNNTGNVNEDNRVLFDKSAAAFRAGGVRSTQWNTSNRGAYSVGFGRDTIASGSYSFAAGDGTTAEGQGSVAFGLGRGGTDNPILDDDWSLGVFSAAASGTGHGWIKLIPDADGDGTNVSVVEITTSNATPTTITNRLYALSDGVYWQDQRLLVDGDISGFGAFTDTGTIIRLNAVTSDDYNKDFVVGNDEILLGASAQKTRRLFWDHAAGYLGSGVLDANAEAILATRGEGSAAFGTNTVSQGTGSLTVGVGLVTTGNNALTVGAGASAVPVTQSVDTAVVVMSPTGPCLQLLGDTNQDSTYIPSINITSTPNTPTVTTNLLFNLNGRLRWGDEQLAFSSELGSGGTGAFVQDGSVVRQNVSGTGNHATDDFVFGAPILFNPVGADNLNRMIFDKDKASFAAGQDTDQWQNMGSYATSFGLSTLASGNNSISAGESTVASGTHSFVQGLSATASGDYSLLVAAADNGQTVDLTNDTTIAVANRVAVGDPQWIKLITAVGESSVLLTESATVSDTNDKLYALSDGLYWDGNRLALFSEIAAGSDGVFVVSDQATDVIRPNYGAVNINNDFVVGSTRLSDSGSSTEDNRMFFDKSAASFHAGSVTGVEWNNRGFYNIVGGFNNTSSGSASAVFGHSNTNTGTQNLLTGRGFAVTGDNNIVLGVYNENNAIAAYDRNNTIAIFGVGDNNASNISISMTTDLDQDGTLKPGLVIESVAAAPTITDNSLWNNNGALTWQTSALVNSPSGTDVITIGSGASDLYEAVSQSRSRVNTGYSASSFLDSDPDTVEVVLKSGATTLTGDGVLIQNTGNILKIKGHEPIDVTVTDTISGNSTQVITVATGATLEDNNSLTLKINGSDIVYQNDTGGTLDAAGIATALAALITGASFTGLTATALVADVTITNSGNQPYLIEEMYVPRVVITVADGTELAPGDTTIVVVNQHTLLIENTTDTAFTQIDIADAINTQFVNRSVGAGVRSDRYISWVEHVPGDASRVHISNTTQEIINVLELAPSRLHLDVAAGNTLASGDSIRINTFTGDINSQSNDGVIEYTNTSGGPVSGDVVLDDIINDLSARVSANQMRVQRISDGASGYRLDLQNLETNTRGLYIDTDKSQTIAYQSTVGGTSSRFALDTVVYTLERTNPEIVLDNLTSTSPGSNTIWNGIELTLNNASPGTTSQLTLEPPAQQIIRVPQNAAALPARNVFSFEILGLQSSVVAQTDLNQEQLVDAIRDRILSLKTIAGDQQLAVATAHDTDSLLIITRRASNTQTSDQLYRFNTLNSNIVRVSVPNTATLAVEDTVAIKINGQVVAYTNTTGAVQDYEDIAQGIQSEISALNLTGITVLVDITVDSADVLLVNENKSEIQFGLDVPAAPVVVSDVLYSAAEYVLPNSTIITENESLVIEFISSVASWKYQLFATSDVTNPELSQQIVDQFNNQGASVLNNNYVAHLVNRAGSNAKILIFKQDVLADQLVIRELRANIMTFDFGSGNILNTGEIVRLQVSLVNDVFVVSNTAVVTYSASGVQDTSLEVAQGLADGINGINFSGVHAWVNDTGSTTLLNVVSTDDLINIRILQDDQNVVSAPTIPGGVRLSVGGNSVVALAAGETITLILNGENISYTAPPLDSATIGQVLDGLRQNALANLNLEPYDFDIDVDVNGNQILAITNNLITPAVFSITSDPQNALSVIDASIQTPINEFRSQAITPRASLDTITPGNTLGIWFRADASQLTGNSTYRLTLLGTPHNTDFQVVTSGSESLSGIEIASRLLLAINQSNQLSALLEDNILYITNISNVNQQLLIEEDPNNTSIFLTRRQTYGNITNFPNSVWSWNQVPEFGTLTILVRRNALLEPTETITLTIGGSAVTYTNTTGVTQGMTDIVQGISSVINAQGSVQADYAISPGNRATVNLFNSLASSISFAITTDAGSVLYPFQASTSGADRMPRFYRLGLGKSVDVNTLGDGSSVVFYNGYETRSDQLFPFVGLTTGNRRTNTSASEFLIQQVDFQVEKYSDEILVNAGEFPGLTVTVEDLRYNTQRDILIDSTKDITVGQSISITLGSVTATVDGPNNIEDAISSVISQLSAENGITVTRADSVGYAVITIANRDFSTKALSFTDNANILQWGPGQLGASQLPLLSISTLGPGNTTTLAAIKNDQSLPPMGVVKVDFGVVTATYTNTTGNTVSSDVVLNQLHTQINGYLTLTRSQLTVNDNANSTLAITNISGSEISISIEDPTGDIIETGVTQAVPEPIVVPGASIPPYGSVFITMFDGIPFIPTGEQLQLLVDGHIHTAEGLNTINTSESAAIALTNSINNHGTQRVAAQYQRLSDRSILEISNVSADTISVSITIDDNNVAYMSGTHTAGLALTGNDLHRSGVTQFDTLEPYQRLRLYISVTSGGVALPANQALSLDISGFGAAANIEGDAASDQTAEQLQTRLINDINFLLNSEGIFANSFQDSLGLGVEVHNRNDKTWTIEINDASGILAARRVSGEIAFNTTDGVIGSAPQRFEFTSLASEQALFISFEPRTVALASGDTATISLDGTQVSVLAATDMSPQELMFGFIEQYIAQQTLNNIPFDLRIVPVLLNGRFSLQVANAGANARTISLVDNPKGIMRVSHVLVGGTGVRTLVVNDSTGIEVGDIAVLTGSGTDNANGVWQVLAVPTATTIVVGAAVQSRSQTETVNRFDGLLRIESIGSTKYQGIARDNITGDLRVLKSRLVLPVNGRMRISNANLILEDLAVVGTGFYSNIGLEALSNSVVKTRGTVAFTGHETGIYLRGSSLENYGNLAVNNCTIYGMRLEDQSTVLCNIPGAADSQIILNYNTLGVAINGASTFSTRNLEITGSAAAGMIINDGGTLNLDTNNLFVRTGVMRMIDNAGGGIVLNNGNVGFIYDNSYEFSNNGFKQTTGGIDLQNSTGYMRLPYNAQFIEPGDADVIITYTGGQTVVPSTIQSVGSVQVIETVLNDINSSTTARVVHVPFGNSYLVVDADSDGFVINQTQGTPVDWAQLGDIFVDTNTSVISGSSILNYAGDQPVLVEFKTQNQLFFQS